MGPIILQGPHQGAQQSSNTGKGESSTLSEKLLSLTFMAFPLKISNVLIGDPHLPHFALFPALSSGILFFVLQEGHLKVYIFFRS
jgi:hypothetical protein